MTPSTQDARATGLVELADGLAQRMSRACDRTVARKGGVLVQSIDWHGLMDLADQARARAALATQPATGRTMGGEERAWSVAEAVHAALWEVDAAARAFVKAWDDDPDSEAVCAARNALAAVLKKAGVNVDA